LKSAGGDFTELVFSRLAPGLTIWALAFDHFRTFFTGDSAYSDLQGASPYDVDE